MKKPDKFILCYVTDRHSLDVSTGQNRDAALVQRVEGAVRAGVHWVQIREKDLPARTLMDLTRAAVRACHDVSAPSETRILVNDRCDVAWAAGAAGVHLGEKSIPVASMVDAKRTSNFLIGTSCHSLHGAIGAAEEGADYLFFGPIFSTPSKGGFGPPQGLPKLAEVCGAVSIPVIAIGGITLANSLACREAGAAGIAAIRLFQQGSIEQIVANLTAN